MKAETLKRVEELDRDYFGRRTLDRLISALAHQVHSMQKEPTHVNARKQVGDILFVLVALARNMNWDLDELLQEVVVKVENRKRERHYYEAHVTVEPIFDERLELFKTVCKEFGFHVADLLMQKRKADTPERSAKDSFCTGRSISYSDIEDRMHELVALLTKRGFRVWRYKIESTLLDSRYDDSLFPLQISELPEKERKPSAPAIGALAGRTEK